MDHSKYRNQDIPMGYVKKNLELNYKEGIDIKGVHYTYAPLLLDMGIFEVDDCTCLSDFELTDTTDDETEELNINSPCASIPDTSTDEDSIDVFDDRVVRKRKLGHDCHIPSTSAPLIHIKREKEDCYRKKKRKNSCMREKKEECGENRKRSKAKIVEIDYSSDSSYELPSHPIHKRSRCSSPAILTVAKYNDLQIKEVSKPPPQLFGYFFCEICNLDLSSEKVYNDHMIGKRHKKNIKLKYVDHAVYQALPPSAATEGQSKYPKPPHGVIRRKVQQRAKIQDVIKNEVKKPCPGLNLVTEIQGIQETQYYCSICNSICSPNSILSHLTGFKHQLNSLKYFRPGDYERMSYERKNLIQDRIVSLLRAIQKKEGLGRMTVEVEELASDSKDIVPYDPCEQSSTKNLRETTSIKLSGMSFKEYYNKATIPDKSTSDFFCQYCDSHMNSEDMWQAHITGKRHINNLKKMPGDRPSKTKTVPLPDARAKLLDRFRDECPNEPIVGLNEIREVQIRETNSVSYNCFLCSSCHTVIDIVEHLVSLKHRKRYLDFMDYPYMQFISGMSDMSSTPIIRSICAQMEAECGRGNPSVHMNKSAFCV